MYMTYLIIVAEKVVFFPNCTIFDLFEGPLNINIFYKISYTWFMSVREQFGFPSRKKFKKCKKISATLPPP